MADDKIHLDTKRRHDFILFFDVTDGNPNGDPDAGNLPRVDPETMQGLVTDVAIKRKVRDYVDVNKGKEENYKIYVQSGTALNAQHKRAYTALGIKATGTKQQATDIDKTRQWMCQNFYDIRMFGAVMTTGVNCGQVRGPLQMTFARSKDRVLPMEVTITRVAVTKEEDLVKVTAGTGEGGSDEIKGKQSEMGRKAIIPYGLYQAHGFFNPHLAQTTGVTSEDLALFWDALVNMWDFDRSASRGMMACQGIYIFSHESHLGNAPAFELFKRVTIKRKPEIEVVRSIDHYDLVVNEAGLSPNVTLTRL